MLTALQVAGGPARAGVLRQDLRTLVAPRNLSLAAAGLGASAIAHRWDNAADERLRGAALFRATSGLTDVYGESLFNLSASLGVYLFARAAHRAELRAVSSDLLRALCITQAVIGPIKYGVRRRRPDGSNRLSFPSGHAANAFATAGVLGRRYGPRAGVPLCLLGAFVGAGRIAGGHHFLSDVVAGSALGAIVGCAVTRTEAARVSLLPVPTHGGWTLAVQVER